MRTLAGVALAALVLAGAAAARPAPCAPRVRLGVLPAWARAGFTDPRPRLPHVVAAGGEIAALLFGYPLAAPPRPSRANKILWVAREPSPRPSDLRIEAQRMDGARRVGRPVRRVVAGGPGPSIVDLPRAGCWRLTLRWSGRTDTLDLRYSPPR